MWFTAGALMASTSLGMLVGGIGTVLTLPSSLRSALLLLAFVLTALLRMAGRAPLAPSIGWTVPRRWRYLDIRVHSLLFGVALGAGFLTILPSIEFYLLLGIPLASASVGFGALLFGFYGLGRSLPLWLSPRYYSGNSMHLTLNAARRFGAVRGLVSVAQPVWASLAAGGLLARL